jgi:LacI family transcriptional regulator
VPTLEGIAKLAKVSRSTVSRVINDDPHVNSKTRKRVLAIIQRLNYHPNVAARGLAAGRTRILGLVIPMGVSALFADPYFPILIQGVSAACNAHDHSVMLWIAEAEYERRMIRQILHNGLVDGVIVASSRLNDPLIDALSSSHIPFVIIGRLPERAKLNYVDVDNRRSAKELVEYMLGRGCRRIGTIAGPKNMIAGRDRLQGYLDALRGKGVASDPNLIVEGDFSEASGQAGMHSLLPFAPDAVFVASDSMAVGALREIRAAGLRVPDDIALAGFDDMPFSARMEPPLTTVRQPVHRTGYVAAEALIDLVDKPGSPTRKILLPTELVIRGSTGSDLP